MEVDACIGLLWREYTDYKHGHGTNDCHSRAVDVGAGQAANREYEVARQKNEPCANYVPMREPVFNRHGGRDLCTIPQMRDLLVSRLTRRSPAS